MTDIRFRARVRGAFGGRSYSWKDICVEPDGTVRVYDAIAGHYTICHSLTPSQIRRLVRQARSTGEDRGRALVAGAARSS
jgi:hypothetical protein